MDKEGFMRKKLTSIILSIFIFGMSLISPYYMKLTEIQAAELPLQRTGYEQMQVIDLGETEDVSITTKRYNSYGSSEWDAYKSDYYYNMMGSNQKAFYDRLYQECQTILTGNKTLDYDTYDSVGTVTEYDLNAEYSQSCYSVFTNRKSVCAGYAEAYELLCNAIGIDTVCVTSSDHEWNKSYVYGMWYLVDCTWDDVGTSAVYDYFNCSDSYAQYGNTSHTESSFWDSYSVPECASDAEEEGYLYDYSYVYGGRNYESVFDVDYYIGKYSDIRKAYGADVDGILSHFVSYGLSEGRRGNNEFNVYAYANRYGDLQSVFGSDLKSYYLHYIDFGKNEGRSGAGTDTSLKNVSIDNVTIYNGVDYAAVYNANYYYNNNQDVAEAVGTDGKLLLEHFVNYGMAEGRQGISSFNVDSYRKQYSDLRQAFGTDLKSYYMHYISWGAKEGRKGTGCTVLQNPVTIYKGIDYSSVYNYNDYIAMYSDIKNAFGDDDITVLQHFVEYGIAEGRKGNTTFGVYNYEAANGDIYNAFRADYKQAVLHYINYGIDEKRCVMPNIDIYNICNTRPDVYAACGGNPDSMINWYITYGSKGL